MKVKVILDGLFTRVEGRPASNNMDKSFFDRYLTIFSSVDVVARCFNVEDSSAKLVEGNNVAFKEVPPFQGPKQLLVNLFGIIKVVFSECLDKDSAIILRLPSTIPCIVGMIRFILRRPFSVELVGDPLDAYSPESLRHPLSKIFQWLFYSSTKFLCRNALACSYVTDNALQNIYPNSNMFSYTSLSLPANKIKKEPRIYKNKLVSPKILMVAMMQNYYKGHDIAIETIKILIKNYNFQGTLLLVGDGPLRNELESLVVQNNLSKNIEFYGKSSAGDEVLNLMDLYDMLLLPSRQEGLPRVIIEGMARGLPCVCTNVGGTKELVNGEQLLDVPLNAEDLAERLDSLMYDEDKLSKLSEINLATSQKYESSLVQKKREDFYSFIINTLEN